jgi:signal transduction histidine kinase
LTFEISPPVLYRFGLEPALEWLTEQFREQQGISIEFEDDDRQKPLDEDVRTALFFGARELLLNVGKHAHARNAKVAVSRNGQSVRIVVQDDGIGFDAAQVGSAMAQSGGYGLFNIQERLRYLGGGLEIRSESNRGTTVTLIAPLKVAEGVEVTI